MAVTYPPPPKLLCLKAFPILLTSVSFWNTSFYPFNLCHVWIHSPLFLYSQHTSTSQSSSHCAITPFAVSSTLSRMAGKKRQPAGGGLCPPKCIATLLSHWHQVFAMKCLYTVQKGHWGGETRGIQPPLGQSVILHMDIMDHVLLAVI